MRLVTFTHSGSTRIGRREGDEIIDLGGSSLPATMLALLEAGPEAMTTAASSEGPRVALSEVRLEAPIARPPKILAVGLNYADHVAEAKMETPQVPMIFNKQSTSVVGPYDDFHWPRASDKLDYEGEMAFVIGKRCRHVPRDRAHEVIAGYTVSNDVSVRDWQIRVPTFTMGKSFDTHCPLGPAIVTADEIGGDPGNLGIRTFVNGEKRQDSNTENLIFDCFHLVEHLSTAFTLEPGDVISTGTPSGVAGVMKPPKWLVPGDVVRVEIEGLDAIENTVIEEPETTTLI